MTGPTPTFESGWDRATYLLAEYKLLISGLLLGVLGLVVYYSPSLPELPGWVGAVLVAWVLLGIPCWMVGMRIVKWLRKRNRVTVFHINAVEDEREKWLVPPAIWQDKKVEDGEPALVNDNGAFEVREFDWQDDAERLVVAGTWMGEATDSQLVTDRRHMKAIHDYLLDAFEQLLQLRATWSDQSIELEGRVLQDAAEARERGQMLNKTSAADVWENYVDDVEMDDDPPELIDQIEDQANTTLDEPLGPEDVDPLGDGTGQEAPNDD